MWQTSALVLVFVALTAHACPYFQSEEFQRKLPQYRYDRSNAHCSVQFWLNAFTSYDRVTVQGHEICSKNREIFVAPFACAHNCQAKCGLAGFSRTLSTINCLSVTGVTRSDTTFSCSCTYSNSAQCSVQMPWAEAEMLFERECLTKKTIPPPQPTAAMSPSTGQPSSMSMSETGGTTSAASAASTPRSAGSTPASGSSVPITPSSPSISASTGLESSTPASGAPGTTSTAQPPGTTPGSGSSIAAASSSSSVSTSTGASSSTPVSGAAGSTSTTQTASTTQASGSSVAAATSTTPSP